MPIVKASWSKVRRLLANFRSSDGSSSSLLSLDSTCARSAQRVQPGAVSNRERRDIISWANVSIHGQLHGLRTVLSVIISVVAAMLSKRHPEFDPLGIDLRKHMINRGTK